MTFYKKELVNEGYHVVIRYFGSYENDLEQKKLDPSAIDITVKPKDISFPDIIIVLKTKDTEESLVIAPNNICLMDVDDTQEHIEHLKMASEMIGQIRKCLEEDFPGILQ